MTYVGSKAKLSKQILSLLHSYLAVSGYTRYIEPFVGGANIIDKIQCLERTGSDVHKYLIALLCAVRDGQVLPDTISEVEYNRVRTNMSAYPDWYVGLCGFCASFGTRWFCGYARNTVDTMEIAAKQLGGTMRDVVKGSILTLRKQADLLSGIDFLHGDYTMHSEVSNAVIYCDPPYASACDIYQGVAAFDSDAFWQWCRVMSVQNIVLISEYVAPADFVSVLSMSHSTSLSRQFAPQFRIEKIFTYTDGQAANLL